MHMKIIALALVAGVSLSSDAHAADLTDTQRVTCEHLIHAFPTPAPVAIAMVEPGNVLFTCEGDNSLGLLVYTMRDAAELDDWQARTHERVIIEGEGDDD